MGICVRRWVAALLLPLLLSACSGVRFNLPGVAESATGGHLQGKVIWHDLLTDTPLQTQAFYRGLFGWEFEPLPLEGANYTLIRHRGRLIGGMVDQHFLPTRADVSQWVVVFSVADAAASAAAIERTGGRVLTPPTSLGERGTIAVVMDNQGAALALLETRDGDPPDGGPAPASGDFLWDELWAGDAAAARDFYRQALGFEVEDRQFSGVDGPMAYHVLRAGGQRRAGLRERPSPDIQPTWASYLSVGDAAELDNILAGVEGLGGRVLVPATDRPAGGRVAVIAGPSGAGIVLQTWTEGQRLGAAGGGQ